MFGKKPKQATQSFQADPTIVAGANKAITAGGQLLDQGRTFFPGQTYADPSANLTAGLGMQADAAAGSGAFMQPGFDLWNQTVSGDFLNPDNLMQLAQPGLDRVASQVNSNAMLSGGSGGSLTAEAAARGATSELGNVINAERSRQMQALGMMPSIDALQYSPGANLARIGNVEMGLEQRGIDENIARHQFEQQAPWMDLERYSGIVRGFAPSLGGTTTSTQPSSSSGIGRLLGIAAGTALGGPAGASLGASLGGMFGGGSGGGGIFPSTIGVPTGLGTHAFAT